MISARAIVINNVFASECCASAMKEQQRTRKEDIKRTSRETQASVEYKQFLLIICKGNCNYIYLRRIAPYIIF